MQMKYLVKQQINFKFTYFLWDLWVCFDFTSFSVFGVKIVRTAENSSHLNQLARPRFAFNLWTKNTFRMPTSFQNDIYNFKRILLVLGSFHKVRIAINQSRVKGCWTPPKKIQMGAFDISKHLGRCVLFQSSCKFAPGAELFQNLTKLH